MMKLARIYRFGDSIMTGTYDPQGGWCDRFKREMHAVTMNSQDGVKRQVYNLGIGGETSRGLVARLESELNARHSNAWPAVLCIGIGKNDSRLKRDGSPEVTPEEYESNLRKIIAVAQEVTEKVLLIGIGPCAKDEINFKDLTYSRARLLNYDQIMKKVAAEESITLVPIYDTLAQAGERAFYRDDLHPSEYGYGLIYEKVKPAILTMLDKD